MNQLETIKILQEKFGERPDFISNFLSKVPGKVMGAVKKGVQKVLPGGNKGTTATKPGKRKEHKTINNYLMYRGLRSVRIHDMPTVDPKKSSGRFAIVNRNGRPIYYIYPFAKIEKEIVPVKATTPVPSTTPTSAPTKAVDEDIGFVLYDLRTKSYKIYKKKLRDTNLPRQKGFMTMEGSSSRIPHYVK